MKTDIAEMKERETSNARVIEKIENSIGAVAEDVLANKVSNDHMNDKLETLDKKPAKVSTESTDWREKLKRSNPMMTQVTNLRFSQIAWTSFCIQITE